MIAKKYVFFNTEWWTNHFRRSFVDKSRPICNAFIFDAASKSCIVGAYEKWKGFSTEGADGATYIDAGVQKYIFIQNRIKLNGV